MFQSRGSEMFEQLAVAVFAGDLAGAEGVLDEMQRCGERSETIRVAKRRARPDMLVTDMVDPNPLKIPFEGAKPGMTLSGKAMW